MNWLRSKSVWGALLIGVGGIARSIAEVVAPEFVPVCEAIMAIGGALTGIGLRHGIAKGSGK